MIEKPSTETRGDGDAMPVRVRERMSQQLRADAVGVTRKMYSFTRRRRISTPLNTSCSLRPTWETSYPGALFSCERTTSSRARGPSTSNEKLKVRDLSERSHDGLWVDAASNIWTFAGRPIHCFAPDGSSITEIRIDAQAQPAHHLRADLALCLLRQHPCSGPEADAGAGTRDLELIERKRSPRMLQARFEPRRSSTSSGSSSRLGPIPRAVESVCKELLSFLPR
ncbi:hypothetical protein GGC47_005313 [Bosea sp. OAE752]|uniref:hypothetical protein n=1 Tax=Bosea sp. OAE752 TaxID=2663873 RepID=UPI003D1A4704